MNREVSGAPSRSNCPHPAPVGDDDAALGRAAVRALPSSSAAAARDGSARTSAATDAIVTANGILSPRPKRRATQ